MELLRRSGESVVVLDNLSRRHRAAVAANVLFYRGDIGDRALVSSIVQKHSVECCIYFAALAYVGESVQNPTLYFENNMAQGIALLGALILESYDRAYGMKSIALRYFNAAGALPNLGEHHEPETHLIPNVLAAARGDASHVEIYGTDYPTLDGTAVRDYIHVQDLAKAHIFALAHLRAGGESDFLNLGNG